MRSSATYSRRYPELARILNDDPPTPKGNRILRNIRVGGTWLDLEDNLNDQTLSIHDNFTQGDPMFIAPQKLDFRLTPESPAHKIGFRPIPVEKIGPEKDGR